MRSTAPQPLWRGRSAALLGIVLMAVNLRTAVAVISPIASDISAEIPLDAVSLGVLGALPPIAFALSGLAAPRLAHRIGLENALLAASAAMLVGHLVRAASGSYPVLLAGSVLALAGMGFGNILIPPAVKRYFPDRVGLMTTAYVTVMSFGATAPAILAAPIADAAGWRVSLGVWALLALGAVIPWFVAAAARRRAPHPARVEDEAPELEHAPHHLVRGLWRSPVAWALATAFAVSALGAYSLFAWLPQLLTQTAGASRAEAGAYLALFAIMGLPLALVVPLLASRARAVAPIVLAGVGFFLVGYGGLLLAPAAAPAVWVVSVGLGTLLFPVVLVLINLRSRTHDGAVALSGFAQGVGYAIGATGPVIVGMLHSTTGAWVTPLLFLIVISTAGVFSAIVLARPRFVEDDVTRRT